MTYNTGNAVPSLDPRDLDDNAQAFDRFLQSTAASELDRLGAPRKTWHQMEADAAALVSPNVAALAALSLAINKGIYATGPSALALYDLSPQARTFSAATTQLAQRLSLQLVKTLSSSDSTAGSMLQVGHAGWNAGTALSQLNTVDTNTLTTSGFYAFGNGGVNLPTTATAYYLRVGNHGALILQEAYGMTAAARNLGYWRVFDGTTWQPWNPVVTSGANSTITSLTGLTTALSIAQGGTGATSAAAALTNLGAAPIASPSLTGTPLSTTPAVGTNTTQIATAAMVQAEIANKRAWTTYTPTVTAGTGSFTTASATGKYMDAFGVRNYQVTITITTVGTGTIPNFTLPTAALAGTPVSMPVGTAREGAVNGKMGVAVIATGLSSATVFGYSGASDNLASANGAIIYVSGSYPIA